MFSVQGESNWGEDLGAEYRLTPHWVPEGVEMPLDGKDGVSQHREGRRSKQNKQYMQRASYSSDWGRIKFLIVMFRDECSHTHKG